MLIYVVVKQRRNHVVGRCNGMKITRKVEVDFVHRQHLGIASACCAALHAEARPQRWFAQHGKSFLANTAQTHGKPYADSGFAYACLGWCNGSDQYQSTLAHFGIVNEFKGQLCNIAPVGFNPVTVNPK